MRPVEANLANVVGEVEKVDAGSSGGARGTEEELSGRNEE